jgi:hypothetical protein
MRLVVVAAHTQAEVVVLVVHRVLAALVVA